MSIFGQRWSVARTSASQHACSAQPCGCVVVCCYLYTALGVQMTVLMLMLAGSDTSKLSHKVLLGVLPDLPPAIIERVRAPLLTEGALLESTRG